MKKEFENKLIERFINENGLNSDKFNFKENEIGILVTDKNNDSMFIFQPLFTENLIFVTFDDDLTRKYQLKFDNLSCSYQWYILGE